MSKKVLQIIPSVLLYITAGLLMIYAIWSYSYCADIISQAKAVGQIASRGNEYEIASFYMSNCGQNVIFALLLTASGLILQRKQPALNDPDKATSLTSGSEAADDELDEWFKESFDEAEKESE